MWSYEAAPSSSRKRMTPKCGRDRKGYTHIDNAIYPFVGPEIPRCAWCGSPHMSILPWFQRSTRQASWIVSCHNRLRQRTGRSGCSAWAWTSTRRSCQEVRVSVPCSEQNPKHWDWSGGGNYETSTSEVCLLARWIISDRKNSWKYTYLLAVSLSSGSPWLYSGFGGVVSPGKGGKWVERALSRWCTSQAWRWFLMNFVSALAYAIPFSLKSESPPILPWTLSTDSPCLVIQICRGARLKFKR